MKLKHLSLRGFIGIYDGLGLEQVEIDFSKLEAGIVALVGENGTGKTTIMESCTPYRKLASRAGALQHHCFLRDSHRILRFEMNGHEYEIKILIDAQTGKQECYLVCDGEPRSDGKTTTYDKLITELFGSEELFFRSLFRAQTAKSFTDLTEGRRKELFAELLGQQHMEQYHEYAKKRRDSEQSTLDTIRVQRETISEQVEANAHLGQQLAQRETEAEHVNVEIAEKRLEIESWKEKLAEHDRDLAQMTALREQHTALVDEIQTKGHEIFRLHTEKVELSTRQSEEKNSLTVRIERQSKILENSAKIDEKVAELNALRLQDKANKEKRDAYIAATNKVNEVQNERDTAVRDHDNVILTAERELSDLERALVSATDRRQLAIDNAKGEIEIAEHDASLLKDVPCGGMEGCQFLVSAYAKRDSVPDLRKRLEEAEAVTLDAETDAVERQKGALTALREQHTALVAEWDEKVRGLNADLDAIGYDPDTYDGTAAAIGVLEREAWERLQIDAQNAAELKRTLTSDMAEMDKRHTSEANALELRLSDADLMLGALREKQSKAEAALARETEIKENRNRVNLFLTEAETKLENLRTRESQLSREIGALTTQIEATEKARESMAQLEKDEAAARTELEEWLFVVKATGKDGIVALELDAAGPQVSQIANELLVDMGNGYQIEFQTMRETADGKKQVEAFEIIVRKEGDDREKPIEMLSGGQKVWIDAALSLAIGVYLRRQAAFDVQTTFMDEADGALDGERAHQYMDMVRACHTVAGIHHTLVITHRKELLAFIPQQIRLTPGIVEIIN